MAEPEPISSPEVRAAARRLIAAAGALLTLAATPACGPQYVRKLRNEASVADSCPAERVVVRPLPRLVDECVRKPPPEEVARDAARLALWDKREQIRVDWWCTEPADFVVEACGHTSARHCWVGWSPNGRTWQENCKPKPSETEIRARFAQACTRGDPRRGPFCDCFWAELRKTFSSAELDDDGTAQIPRFLVAKDSALLACGARKPEDTVHGHFIEGCIGSGGPGPFCDCAWTVTRAEGSAEEIDGGRADMARIRPKIEASCGKLR